MKAKKTGLHETFWNEIQAIDINQRTPKILIISNEFGMEHGVRVQYYQILYSAFEDKTSVKCCGGNKVN